MKVLSFFLALATADHNPYHKPLKPIHHPDHPRNSPFAHNRITSSGTGLPFHGKFEDYPFKQWRPWYYRTDRIAPFQPDAAFMQRMRRSTISFNDTLSILSNRWVDIGLRWNNYLPGFDGRKNFLGYISKRIAGKTLRKREPLTEKQCFGCSYFSTGWMMLNSQKRCDFPRTLLNDALHMRHCYSETWKLRFGEEAKPYHACAQIRVAYYDEIIKKLVAYIQELKKCVDEGRCNEPWQDMSRCYKRGSSMNYLQTYNGIRPEQSVPYWLK